MTAVMKRKVVSLTFRGFEIDPCQVEALLGVSASSVGRRGSPVKPGVETVLLRSFAKFAIELDAGCRLDEVVPSLLNRLGGVEKISQVRDAVSPEFFELDITWPVKWSDEQEGGFFPTHVIADLFHLKCALSFGFV
ncbi:hypothetical protein [Montanilutibacter psychrotolerans]|uniref:DUF4279 domain-containing protein n=1 Tax=Montanilutibacter psychrotolerans TaxID=1327343 RepID=A0A3M8SYA0_9GAMM|nr:hypothetical protein [Lysobacter psychrotolerans]RNF86388.1 hypothetical protein EER27_02930 [Lysobacter psychrotolerans]